MQAAAKYGTQHLKERNVSAKQLPQKLHQFAYSPYWEGKRLKEIVRTVMPQIGSRDALLVIKNGLVGAAGGERIDDADASLPEGATLEVDLRHGVHGRGRPKHKHLHDRMKVVHDDEHLVVVMKNAGTAVQPKGDEADGKSHTAPLVELLKHYWKANNKPYVNPILVQRLDQGTSGLMVLGKTAEAARYLQSQLRGKRKLRREYLAIVAGDFQTDRGAWKTYIGKGKIGLRQTVAANVGRKPQSSTAQYAETQFEVVERFGDRTLLRLKLETGRTHQIRIHCAEAGHPVLGDDVYTRLAENTIDRVAKGKAPTEMPDHPYAETEKLVRGGVIKLELPKKAPKRLALHATRLSFEHPATRKRMTFEDALPEELRRFLAEEKPRK